MARQASGTITITASRGKAPFRVRRRRQRTAVQGERGPALLWARHRITVLSDYNRLRPDDSRIGEVTRLGLDYNLLTAYTSFVAVDTLVRTDGLRPTTVKQPLPCPRVCPTTR
jgi:Ca-activated chloride channel family protein